MKIEDINISDDDYSRAPDDKPFENDDEASEQARRFFNCGYLFRKYNTSFLLIYCAQYINQAFKFTCLMGFQLILKDHYNLSPSATGSYISIVWLPWALKLVYGILFDSVPLFGSRKKSWMIVTSLIVLATTLTVSLVEFDNPISLLVCFTI